jgi:hypothetical protein
MTDTLEIAHWLGPRVWRRTGSREHEIFSGRFVRVQVWESVCIICGQSFEIGAMSPRSKNFRLLTCKAHRLTWREAMSLWRKRKRRSRFKRAFEKIRDRKMRS